MIRYFRSIAPLLYKKDVTVIVKLPHPEVDSFELGKLGQLCKKEIFRPIISKKCFTKGVPKADFYAKMKSIDKLMDFFETEHPNLKLWNISNITCPGEHCHTVTSDKQYLRDSHHLFSTSPTLSNDVASHLNQLLNNNRSQKKEPN